MTERIAILGAGGFIGNRAVEMLTLGGHYEVRPVVRAAQSLALASRFALDGRIADGRDQVALEAAFGGCSAVIHAMAGDPQTIVAAIEPVYRAAAAAGVKRLIYLSSASVHGQSPALGTTELSPLSERQPIEYNNAKVRAERLLMRLRQQGAWRSPSCAPVSCTGRAPIGSAALPMNCWLARPIWSMAAQAFATASMSTISSMP